VTMKNYADEASEIMAWTTVVETVRCNNFDDVRGMFKDADFVDGCMIFNIRRRR